MNDENTWIKAKQVWEIESGTINELSRFISKEEFLSAVKLISGCKGKVITSGAGTSAAAAKKISHSLSCIERPSFFLSPSDAVHGSLGSVSKDDIVILISKGGNTKEIINLIDPVKTKKAFILGVTENYDSILGSRSDHVIKVKVDKEADSFNMLATSSTLAVIAVFDAICITVMELTGYTKERFAVIHPEGAVGERLKKVFKENK